MLDLTANIVFADGPSTHPHQPQKWMVRKYLRQFEDAVGAGLSNGGLIYDTKASMDADLAHDANASAWVMTGADSGIYRKSGTSGAGGWTKIASLPYSYIAASNVGTGTAVAIQAGTDIPVPAADGAALIALPIAIDNTASPVTVSFNGGTPLTIKTASGNDVAPGGLNAGMMVWGQKIGTMFQLLSDQASGAIQAAAEAAQSAAANSAMIAAGYSAMLSADKIKFKTVPLLIADTIMSYSADAGKTLVAAGDAIDAGGYRYEVASSAAVDYQVQTVGGVKLRRISQPFAAIDADPGNIVWRPRAQQDFTTIAGANRSNVTYAQVLGLWEDLRARFPNWITRTELGKDQSNTYSIYKYVMTPEAGYDRTVVVDAGIHGLEVMNVLCCFLFFKEMAEVWDTAAGGSGVLSAARHRVRWVVVPSLNPWGLSQNPKTRQNSRGVDINRNFDYRWSKFTTGGTNPFDVDYKGTAIWSEAESRLIRDLVASYPDCISSVSLHDYVTPKGEKSAALYVPEFAVVNNRLEPAERLNQLATLGITIEHATNPFPNAFNYFAKSGINTGNPEWAFNFVTPTYSAADVTAALTYYGNILLAYAFSAPAKAASRRSPVIKRYSLTAPVVIPLKDSLEDCLTLLPDILISTEDLADGIVTFDLTVVMTSGHSTKDISVNIRPGFGQDGSMRSDFRSSVNIATISTRTRMAAGGKEVQTVSVRYAMMYYSSPTQFVRVLPRIASRFTDNTPNDGTSPITVTSYEAILTFMPSDAGPSYSWRGASGPSSVWGDASYIS